MANNFPLFYAKTGQKYLDKFIKKLKTSLNSIIEHLKAH